MSKRLDVIKSHFAYPEGPNALDQFRQVKLNLALLRETYLSPHPEISEKFASEILNNPLFDLHAHVEKPREMQREIVMKQLLYLYPKFYKQFDFTSGIQRAAFGICLSDLDQSLSTRYMVHAILYLETIEFLGSEKHQYLVKRGLDLQDYGCFAMTEIGHGSNVAGVETTATYDPSSKGFIINSPTPNSTKFWIGALANTANMAVVFAQLIVSGNNCGVHVFAVKIRDEQHNPMQGIVIGDCGPKAGLAGIDNGFMMFHNYKVSADTLLNRLSGVTEDGKFKSTIKNKEKRFGIMLSGLTGGRCGILGNTESNMRSALTIAIRYGTVRRQFGKGEESQLMSYQLHKYRLMPYLAKCFAARMGYQIIAKLYLERKELFRKDPEGILVNELHALLSVFKYINGRSSQDCIQECRESCGGHGYSAFAGFSRLRENNDIHLTWDGDNNVLIQQCSRFLLKSIISHFKGNPQHSEYITFLNAPKLEFTADNLKNPLKLIAMLEYRTHVRSQKATNKLQGNANSDPSVAWNNSQVQGMHLLSISFGELVAAKELWAYTNRLRQTCVDTGNAVEKVFMLYVLSIFEKDFEGMSEEEHKIVQDLVVKYCEDVADLAVKLIDGIALPDQVLNSVLGCADGNVYKRYMKEVENAPGVYDKPAWTQLLVGMRNLFN